MSAALRLAALLAAASFFIWMFLAVAPVEVLADSGGLAAAPAIDVRIEAYRFASDWRHGMTGNSPLYMPGFFLLAIAVWVWCGGGASGRPGASLVVEGAAVLLVAVLIAWTTADLAAGMIARDLERAATLEAITAWPSPGWRAVVQGSYTAAAWITGIVACQRALSRRSWKPLLIIVPVTAVLAAIRPWTVDDFIELWGARIALGDLPAVSSALAIPTVTWMLIALERRPWWRHRQRQQVFD
jgi:hypothetical protein